MAEGRQISINRASQVQYDINSKQATKKEISDEDVDRIESGLFSDGLYYDENGFKTEKIVVGRKHSSQPIRDKNISTRKKKKSRTSWKCDEG